jgi:hypothetical protein
MWTVLPLALGAAMLLAGCGSGPSTTLGGPVTTSPATPPPTSPATSPVATAPATTAAPPATSPAAPAGPVCSSAALEARMDNPMGRTVVLGSGLRNVQCRLGWAMAVTSPPETTSGPDPALVVFEAGARDWTLRGAGTGNLCATVPAEVARAFPDFC